MLDPAVPMYHQNLGAAPRTLLFLRPKGAISIYKRPAGIWEIFQTPPLPLSAAALQAARYHCRFLILEAIFQHEGL